MKIFLGVSFLLHCLLMLFFYLDSSSKPEPVPETIAFDLLETKSAGSGGPGRGGRKKGKKTSSSLRMKDLLPALAGAPSVSAVSKGSTGWDATDWGEGGAGLEHVASLNNLQKLLVELDGLFYYPNVFRLRQISGAVNARLFFSDSGGCDWERTRVKPAEMHMRVYILALLKKVCALEQIKKMKLVSTDHADLNFNLRLVDVVQKQDVHDDPLITGNVLLLQRHEIYYPMSIPLGPIRLFGSQIVDVNFDWLYGQWDKLAGEKDPMEEFR
jgi:hypothetical protein